MIAQPAGSVQTSGCLSRRLGAVRAGGWACWARDHPARSQWGLGGSAAGEPAATTPSPPVAGRGWRLPLG
ncbi:MAG: hypothetical protein OZSIB_0799 [Candidatus Ozemobacter sibiricus]|uniref:Uncharacterized protein n=1 Tax=Candidatus Ozemobacter sibiricus TaxID=2268124 RepID=A0A367ZU39_9BACT|nr:MAG: hypothetical protein OZSIB_0799 [Candidatus Ozemobacter sibiricus]